MKSTASDMGSQIKSLRDETGQKCGIAGTDCLIEKQIA